MTILKGKDLTVLVGGKPVFHATQHQITLNAEFEDYETKSTPSKQKVLTGHSGTVQVDGLVGLTGIPVAAGEGGAATELSTVALIKQLKAGTPVELLSDIPDGEEQSAPVEIPGAWLTSISVTGQVGQNSTYSAQFSFNDFDVAAQ